MPSSLCRYATACSGLALRTRNTAAPLDLALPLDSARRLPRPGAPAAGRPHLAIAPGLHRCGPGPGPPRSAGQTWTSSARTWLGASPQHTRRRSASSCVAERFLGGRSASAPESCVSVEACGAPNPCASRGRRQYPAEQGSSAPVPGRQRPTQSRQSKAQRQHACASVFAAHRLAIALQLWVTCVRRICRWKHPPWCATRLSMSGVSAVTDC